jgi:hypothetical protein
MPRRLEHVDCAITVLNVGGVDQDGNHKATGVGEDVALATLDLFARVIAARPPDSVVLTL